MKSLTTYPRRADADDGYSFAELIIVLGLLSIVIALAYLLLNSTTVMADRVDARSIVKEQVRVAVDLMTRELRQADEPVQGAGAFATASPRECVFYVDLNHDLRPERVTYKMSGVSLVRTAASPTNQVAPYTYGAESAAETLVTKIDPGFTGPIFTYYDTNTTDLGSGQGPRCSLVKVHVIGEAPVGTNNPEVVTVELTTWVKLRALFNGVE
jgi:hypothetical protein